MLKFYYSKGSSALAAHILLNEVAAQYEAVEVSIPDGDHLKADYLRRNPKGRIPALETPDGVITENPAILEYIAATHPNVNALPKTLIEQAQARSLAAYLCSTVHVAFAHKHRGVRWAKEHSSLDDMRSMVPKNLSDCAAVLESELVLDPWVFGQTYTYCDPYLFLLGQWLSKAGLEMDAYPKLAAHHAALLARPATQDALKQHGLS